MRSCVARLAGLNWKGSRSSARSAGLRWNTKPKSNQPRFGLPTAEGAEVRGVKVILNNLCEPAAPSAVGSLVPMLCGVSNPQLLSQQIQKRSHVRHHAQGLLRPSVGELRDDRRIDVHAN